MEDAVYLLEMPLVFVCDLDWLKSESILSFNFCLKGFNEDRN